jgi:ABC-type transport system involved in multi-copper enzyme maturation permease subunit
MEAVASESIPSGFATLWPAFRLFLRRLLWSKFMIADLLLVSLPLVIAVLMLLTKSVGSMHRVHETYESLVYYVFLHIMVFFLATIIGFGASRQEIEDQTLHYLFLQPVPRWALCVGRYLGCLALTSATCIAALWLTYFLLALSLNDFSQITADLFSGGRGLILLKESGIIVMGLAAYTAIAFFFCSLFKSALFAGFLFVWEGALPYAPQVFKQLTIMHYLQSMLPDPAPQLQNVFSVMGEASPVWLCMTVLGSVAAVMLALTVLVFQFKECQYGDN